MERGVVEILAVMAAGVLVGATVFPARLKGLNEKLTLAATGLLIFSMGVLLAGRDSFLEELGQVGWASILFCLVPVAFSTIAVYALIFGVVFRGEADKGVNSGLSSFALWIGVGVIAWNFTIPISVVQFMMMRSSPR